MTERDIRGLFAALPEPEGNKEIVRVRIEEERLVVLDRIATALEQINLNTMPRIKP